MFYLRRGSFDHLLDLCLLGQISGDQLADIAHYCGVEVAYFGLDNFGFLFFLWLPTNLKVFHQVVQSCSQKQGVGNSCAYFCYDFHSPGKVDGHGLVFAVELDFVGGTLIDLSEDGSEWLLDHFK